MTSTHDLNEPVDTTFDDPASQHTLEYARPGEAQPHASTREMVEFGLMGLVYFMLPLLLLFVLQVLFPWL